MVIQQLVKTFYFPHLSAGYFLLSWGGMILIELAILAVIILFSGLVRGSFTVLLMTISYYLICNGLPVVRDAAAQHQLGDGTSQGADFLLKGLTLIFPDFNRLDYKTFIVSEAVLPAHLTYVTGFGLLLGYMTLTLGFACAVYRHRDLK
jgi:hypothetical protein